jgi:mannose-6-phosphate isomerase-like protein (cupin superfamily)
MSGEIELISDRGMRLALIIRDARTDERVKFFSDAGDALQVGAFCMARGQEIEPHVHRDYPRFPGRTTEVLVIQSGRIRVDFYSCEQAYIQSRELDAGDVIILFDGGHGFTILDDVRMLEIKQGPYAGELDKTRFERPPDIPISA